MDGLLEGLGYVVGAVFYVLVVYGVIVGAGEALRGTARLYWRRRVLAHPAGSGRAPARPAGEPASRRRRAA